MAVCKHPIGKWKRSGLSGTRAPPCLPSPSAMGFQSQLSVAFAEGVEGLRLRKRSPISFTRAARLPKVQRKGSLQLRFLSLRRWAQMISLSMSRMICTNYASRPPCLVADRNSALAAAVCICCNFYVSSSLHAPVQNRVRDRGFGLTRRFGDALNCVDDRRL